MNSNEEFHTRQCDDLAEAYRLVADLISEMERSGFYSIDDYREALSTLASIAYDRRDLHEAKLCPGEDASGHGAQKIVDARRAAFSRLRSLDEMRAIEIGDHL